MLVLVCQQWRSHDRVGHQRIRDSKRDIIVAAVSTGPLHNMTRDEAEAVLLMK